MNKYFATISCGARMTTHMIIEANNKSLADDEAREECIDWASSFGYYQDPDVFGNNDELGKDGTLDEDTGEYEEESELVYGVTRYNPEEHDDLL